MQISPFCEPVEGKKGFYIFNRLLLDVFECDEELFSGIKKNNLAEIPKDIMCILTERGFVVDEGFNADEELKKWSDKSHKKTRINRYRILITEKCNFGCKYCFVHLSGHDGLWDSIQHSLDLLIKANKGESVQIQFFGGEPLMQFEYIEKTVNYMKEHGTELKDVTYFITTNGSLLTDSKCEYLKKNDFRVGVSLDGPKEMNDKMRVLPNGHGTYDLAVRGFKLLKKHGVKNFILVTPSPTNLESLYSICRYIVNELKPAYLTVNLPQYDYGFGVDGKIFAEQIIQIILLCAEKKVGLTSPASQVLSALKHKDPVIKTCSTTCDTASASITIDGRITYCPINFEETLFPKKVGDLESLDFPELQKWFGQNPFDHPICKDCIAITTCGGVCPMQSKMKHPEREALVLDKDKCDFYKHLTVWAIENY